MNNEAPAKANPNKDSIEFSPGDIVTFKPYEKEIKALVKKVLPNYWGDGKMIYHLVSPPTDRSESVISRTSGKCIMESVHYEE